MPTCREAHATRRPKRVPQRCRAGAKTTNLFRRFAQGDLRLTRNEAFSDGVFGGR